MRFKVRSTLLGVCMMTAFAAVSTTPAFAASKPVVETKAATGANGTEETVNGTVNPEGLETKYYFQYGTTTSYGSKTAEVSAGSGTASLAEYARLTGLKLSTKYDFRIVASNSDGTTDGGNLSFTTTASTKPPEFVPANKQKFTSAGTEVQLNDIYGTITCKNETASGEVTGTYTVGKVNVKFTGCTVTTSVLGYTGCTISSKGAANEGEIVISPLKGQLGVVPTTEAASGVGLLLERETSEEWVQLNNTERGFNEECSHEISLHGKLALEVGVVGSSQLTNKFTGALDEKGLNIRELKLASGETVKPKLLGREENATLAGVDAVTFGEKTEVT